MEKTKGAPGVRAFGLVHMFTLLTWVPVIALLVVPFANFVLGLRNFAEQLAVAVTQKRALKLLGAVLLSVPVGMWLTAQVGEIYDWRSGTWGLVYMFISGPAFAGLAGAIVVSWPVSVARAS